jgi:hypothetical protein
VRRSRLALLLVLVTLGVAGCGDDEGGGGGTVTITETATATAPATTATTSYPARTPEKALDELLDRILADEQYRSEGFEDGAFVTPRFIAAIQRLKAEAESQGLTGLEFDPFLCAQQLPERVSFEPGAITGDTAAVAALMDYGSPDGPTRQTYRMKLVNGRWLLDASDCVK